MAVPNNTYQTYQTVGIREDLIDKVFNLSPTETPLVAAIPRVKATQTKHEWLTDALAAPAANAQIEGDDASADAITPAVRLNNYTQISRKVAQVSGTDAAVKGAANVNTMQYALLKKSKELKKDMEFALFANQSSAAGSAGVARNLAGIPAWLSSNVDFGATGANPATPGTARTDGTLRPITEANVKTVLSDAFTNTARCPKLCFVSAPHKQLFSTFTGNVTRFVDVNSAKAKLQTAYEVYVSDFGEIKLVPDLQQRSRDIIFINPEFIAMAYLRAFEKVPLSKTGDSERIALYAEYTLEMRNEAGHAAIYDAS